MIIQNFSLQSPSVVLLKICSDVNKATSYMYLQLPRTIARLIVGNTVLDMLRQGHDIVQLRPPVTDIPCREK